MLFEDKRTRVQFGDGEERSTVTSLTHGQIDSLTTPVKDTKIAGLKKTAIFGKKPEPVTSGPIQFEQVSQPDGG